jgi:hypothetical protein
MWSCGRCVPASTHLGAVILHECAASILGKSCSRSLLTNAVSTLYFCFLPSIKQYLFRGAEEDLPLWLSSLSAVGYRSRSSRTDPQKSSKVPCIDTVIVGTERYLVSRPHRKKVILETRPAAARVIISCATISLHRLEKFQQPSIPTAVSSAYNSPVS